MSRCLIIVLMVLVVLVNGQAQNEQITKVTLKNGSVLVGVLKYYNPDSAVVLTVAKQDIILKMKAVKKVVMLTPKLELVKTPFAMDDKWYNNTRVSMLANEERSSFAVSHTLYYHLTPRLLPGIGVGFENYYNSSTKNTVPVYADVKYYFQSSRISPFVSTRYGYGFLVSKGDGLTSNSRGGSHFGLSGGLRLSGPDLMVELFAGLKLQVYYLETVIGKDYISKVDLLTRRIEVGVSMMY